ncbi:MAG: M20/M25/M40 family metallo-hydrolase [Planctomycetes bacterium]|nr:M20/M25/M40 family metallo-hydrolase [Planctomycetota bacterium]
MPHRTPTPLLRVTAFLLVATTGLTAQQAALDDGGVDEALCRQWLGTLAGPEFAGRGTGQAGYGKAAAYVAAHFRALGLEARGDDGSYFQQMPWVRSQAKSASLKFRTDEGSDAFEVAMERLTGAATVSADADGDVVLLQVPAPDGASGGRRAALEIPGLDDVDLEGKVVVAVVHGQGRSAAFARFGVQRALQGKQAAAVLFATIEPVSGGLQRTEGAARRGGANPAAAARSRQPLDLTFGGDDLQQLLQHSGTALQDAGAEASFTSLPLRCAVHLEVESEDAPAMNVFAVLPGGDPKLRDEYIVIGSHLDHLGERGGVIHPGADDDGSGTTGVMAVAQMFAKAAEKPRRSVLFVCFSGEERGLLGSRHFVENCPIPLESIAAELQMDMIGRDEEEAMDGGRRVNIGETAEQNRNSLHLVGTEQLAPALHDLCLAVNERAGFDLEYDQESLFLRSDHANFAQRGVPVAFFFTGLHMDYHQPSDTPDKIHYAKLLRVARYVHDIAWQLATQDGRPEISPALWQAFRERDRRGSAPEQPAAPMAPADK